MNKNLVKFNQFYEYFLFIYLYLFQFEKNKLIEKTSPPQQRTQMSEDNKSIKEKRKEKRNEDDDSDQEESKNVVKIAVVEKENDNMLLKAAFVVLFAVFLEKNTRISPVWLLEFLVWKSCSAAPHLFSNVFFCIVMQQHDVY